MRKVGRRPGGPGRAMVLGLALLAAAPLLASAGSPDPGPAAAGTTAGGTAASHGFGSLLAQEWKLFRSARQAGDFESLELEVVYGAGELAVAPAEGPYLYDVRMRFDASRFVPVRSWSASEGRAMVRVALTSSGSAGERPVAIHLDDFDLDFDLSDLKKLGDSAGRLDVRLSPDVPTDLRVHVGAARSDLDLGGLPITRLEVNTGASETELSFREPNPVSMERLQLKVGAAEFRTEKLGNARFERFSFEGGVGDVLLDFTGDWEDAAPGTAVRGTIQMGVGALRIRVPRELGVRIAKKSFLTSFDAAGFTRAGDAFQTTNWNQAGARLELDLDAAFGSIAVEVVP